MVQDALSDQWVKKIKFKGQHSYIVTGLDIALPS